MRCKRHGAAWGSWGERSGAGSGRGPGEREFCKVSGLPHPARSHPRASTRATLALPEEAAKPNRGPGRALWKNTDHSAGSEAPGERASICGAARGIGLGRGGVLQGDLGPGLDRGHWTLRCTPRGDARGWACWQVTGTAGSERQHWLQVEGFVFKGQCFGCVGFFWGGALEVWREERRLLLCKHRLQESKRRRWKADTVERR
ncbi:uncharacterized protein LOC113830912 isoform X1 [Cricetulus griseus]|uniref:uncharacterized protein LOC113830912 isoform X1 n=1 Tax=Cricetulus griseus TaxID=10029 RepID=UPI0015C33FE2|nr:uncharacterized protein LOC113830912 isoform X1 [Cricetulus griseus]